MTVSEALADCSVWVGTCHWNISSCCGPHLFVCVCDLLPHWKSVELLEQLVILAVSSLLVYNPGQTVLSMLWLLLFQYLLYRSLWLVVNKSESCTHCVRSVVLCCVESGLITSRMTSVMSAWANVSRTWHSCWWASIQNYVETSAFLCTISSARSVLWSMLSGWICVFWCLF